MLEVRLVAEYSVQSEVVKVLDVYLQPLKARRGVQEEGFNHRKYEMERNWDVNMYGNDNNKTFEDIKWCILVYWCTGVLSTSVF